MLNGLGVLDFPEENNFQDLAFNFSLPTKKWGNFSLFGIGGVSVSEQFIDKDTIDRSGTEEIDNFSFQSDMGVAGLDHKYFFDSETYLKTVIALTGQRISYFEDSISRENLSETRLYEERFLNSALRVSTYLNKKLNARQTIRAGIIGSRRFFDLYGRYRDQEDQQFKTSLMNEGHADTWQAYGQWKHKLNEKWVLNLGLHSQYFALNESITLEPRLGLQWNFTDGQSLSFGAGVHSRLEDMSIYMARQLQANGSYTQPNRDLLPTRAIHYVIGYDRFLNENLRLKTEVYYQYLYDVPVWNEPNSTESTINFAGGYTTDDLINKGTGSNLGLELTLERFFANHFYYMFTSSVFDSKYQALSPKTFDSRYNANYRFSLLGGKEYKVGKQDKNLFSLNLKGIWSGGNRYTPINLQQSVIAGEEVVYEDRRFESQVPDYLRLDMTSSYRINREKVAHIISLQVQNITNRENIFDYYYDEETQQIETEYQFGLLPILKYRIEF